MTYYIVEGLFIISSFLWMVLGIVNYGFWGKGLPGDGFFPFFSAALTFILCVSDLVLYLHKKGKHNPDTQEKEQENSDVLGFVPHKLKPFFITGYIVLGTFILQYVGVLTATFFMCLIWLVYIAKKPVVHSLLYAFAVTVVIFFIFVVWLQIPFPKGFLI